MNTDSEDEESLISWVDSLVTNLDRVAASALGIKDFEVLGKEGPPVGQMGGFVPMIGERSSVQLAVISTEDTCRQMSAMLLGMEPDEAEELSDEDVGDGIGELLNIVAGAVKTDMISQDPSVKLGLPFVVHGRVEPAANTGMDVVQIRCGEFKLTLMVLSDASLKTSRLAA